MFFCVFTNAMLHVVVCKDKLFQNALFHFVVSKIIFINWLLLCFNFIFFVSCSMIYQTRWSAKRLRDYANSLNDEKRAILSESSFGDMMYISPFAAPPKELVDFVAMRIDTEKRKFK